MKRLYIIIIFLLFAGIRCHAQQHTVNESYTEIDIKALAIPLEETNSIDNLSNYINKNFETSACKVRAIFTWIINNISYDTSMMNVRQLETDIDKIGMQTLKERKGICFHYSNFFKVLTERTGIKTYCINGYTKKDGQLMNTPHVWCLSQIDLKWYFFDPTWGAGHILDNIRFVSEPNYLFYKVKPIQMIKTHMPFDPMWQLLDYPLKYPEFDNFLQCRTDSSYFNALDTLQVNIKKDQLEQIVDSRRRMLHNGEGYFIVRNQLCLLDRNINILRANQSINIYNEVLQQFNKGIEMFNIFIRFRNHQFKPEKKEKEVREMINSCIYQFIESDSKLQNILTSDKNLLEAIAGLKQKIQEAFTATKQQQIFIDKYYSTRKGRRKYLFYEFT